MNSLPLISHHLFVAAIGNEDRAHARPARRERPSAGPDGPTRAMVLEVVDARKPMAERAAGTLGARLAEVRA